MTYAHIYTASSQPATCFTDNCSDKPFTTRWPGNRLLYARCCNERRPAKNCVVQCFYDGLYVWCTPGKGCRHPEVLAKKRRTEFRNRSRGQRARWASAESGNAATARSDVPEEFRK